jgi:hypothetical protein
MSARRPLPGRSMVQLLDTYVQKLDTRPQCWKNRGRKPYPAHSGLRFPDSCVQKLDQPFRGLCGWAAPRRARQNPSLQPNSIYPKRLMPHVRSQQRKPPRANGRHELCLNRPRSPVAMLKEGSP